MRPILVGVDICNTIADINSQIESCFHVKTETYPVYGVPGDFFSSPGGLAMFRNAAPYAYATTVLWNIARAGCCIIYVTTRPPKAVSITEKWLRKHGFPDGQVVFTSRESKADYIIQTGISYAFEDDPLILNTLLRTNVKYVFVKEWIYNRGLKNKKVIRFRNWRELLGWPFNKTNISLLFGLNGNRGGTLKAVEGECNEC